MLCSVLHSMCPFNSSSQTLKQLSLFHLQPPQQELSPPTSPLSSSMPSNFFSTLPSVYSHSMSTITPPGSPPSPTMSVDSIHGHRLSLDLTLAQMGNKIKVMIVDDNSVNLAILSRILKVHFAETVELAAVMTSGVAALEKLKEEKFDLILMDIDMPVLNGVETTVAIRQPTSEYSGLEKNQNVPIIAVTTSDGQSQRELYQQVGMSDCVSKPIVVQKLRSAIEKATSTPQ